MDQVNPTARLTPRNELAYLVCAVEHVLIAADAVESVPRELRLGLFQQTMQLARTFIEQDVWNDDEAQRLTNSLNEAWENIRAQATSSLLHLVSAMSILLERNGGRHPRSRNVLNHLEAYVELVDPDDEGAGEEGEWQERVLALFIQETPGTGVVNAESMVREKLPWMDRYADDYSR
ncbi:MAG: hypothetical protein H6726_29895 [Sandaracinaceae bacterium]|nr:hypothetical protein [Sandaracinaceae bacterium]